MLSKIRNFIYTIADGIWTIMILLPHLPGLIRQARYEEDKASGKIG